MPKLNTTIDNLEWKSNKIISTSTMAPDDWTDEQYPSAKTLLNISHPIGSVLVTSANTDPATTLGGQWTLVDKAFKDKFIVIDSSHWTATNATITEFSGVALADHTMAFRLNLVPTTELNDNTITLGKLDLQHCGISALTYAVWYGTAISDGGNSSICYGVSQDGTITTQEVLNVNNTHVMPKDFSFYIHLTVPVNHDYMLDAFCDKFYWKRTA